MPPSSSDPRKWQRAIERYSSFHIPELKESATLEVNDSSDVAVMREMTMNLGMGLIMSCMAEITRELQNSGMDEEDIDNFLTEKQNEMVKACFCENKSVLSEWLPMVRPDRCVRTGCNTGLSNGIWKS